jgi:hypothetical protein
MSWRLCFIETSVHRELTIFGVTDIPPPCSRTRAGESPVKTLLLYLGIKEHARRSDLEVFMFVMPAPWGMIPTSIPYPERSGTRKNLGGPGTLYGFDI